MTVDGFESCVACGALGHGNISCERCVLMWDFIDACDRWWLVRYAKTKIEWSPYPDNVQKIDPWDDQKAGIAYAMARPGTLIGDEMGLGKGSPRGTNPCLSG